MCTTSHDMFDDEMSMFGAPIDADCKDIHLDRTKEVAVGSIAN